MLKINYSPTAYLFTSNLPSEIFITTDATSVEISVTCGTNTVFTTTLYPYDKLATLYDLRSIIEGYMSELHLVYTTLSLKAVTSTETASTSQVAIVYSRLNVTAGEASSFIQSFFLTTRPSFSIPRNSFQQLAFCLLPNITTHCYTECLALFDGETTPRVVRLTDSDITVTKFSLQRITINPAALESRIGQSCRLLQFTVHRGFRSKTFYVTDRTPNLTLQVRGEFNCIEYIHLTCVTKKKLSLDRSTATCLGITSFYDDQSEYEYEVESSMLPYDQAIHFTQLLLSPFIYLVDYNDSNIPILITDISHDISDAHNATNSIKFKYKYTRHRLPVRIKYPANIFDDPFNRTFD